MTGSNLYDVLGVAPDASPAEIRDAYRSRAREAHPDRQTTPSASAAMASLNEAYRVLRDPGRRALYDSTMRATGSAAQPESARPSTTRTAWSNSTDGVTTEWFESSPARGTVEPGAIHPSQLGPARVPWRMLLFCGAVACVAVIVLAQFTDPGTPRGPDGILHVGECVSIEPNTDAREVACRDDPTDPDLIVRAFIPFGARCPGLTEPHRDRQGMGIACIDLIE